MSCPPHTHTRAHTLTSPTPPPTSPTHTCTRALPPLELVPVHVDKIAVGVRYSQHRQACKEIRTQVRCLVVVCVCGGGEAHSEWSPQIRRLQVREQRRSAHLPADVAAPVVANKCCDPGLAALRQQRLGQAHQVRHQPVHVVLPATLVAAARSREGGGAGVGTRRTCQQTVHTVLPQTMSEQEEERSERASGAVKSDGHRLTLGLSLSP